MRDVGLPAPLNRMIPLVEFVMQTPLDTRDAGRTTGTINPGVIWFGRYFQVGLEAVVPVNGCTGKNVGVLGPDCRDTLSLARLIDLVAYLRSLDGEHRHPPR